MIDYIECYEYINNYSFEDIIADPSARQEFGLCAWKESDNFECLTDSKNDKEILWILQSILNVGNTFTEDRDSSEKLYDLQADLADHVFDYYKSIIQQEFESVKLELLANEDEL